MTVYFSGIHFNRSLTANLYLSLGIIAAALFLFMTYGLYRGFGLVDDFPKIRDFKSPELLSNTAEGPDLELPSVGEGIGGLLASILLWIVMTVLFVILLIVLEVVFWFSLFLILAMLYWVFFRALKLVFAKSGDTKGRFGISVIYSLTYTLLYVGWIFGIVYLAEMMI